MSRRTDEKCPRACQEDVPVPARVSVRFLSEGSTANAETGREPLKTATRSDVIPMRGDRYESLQPSGYPYHASRLEAKVRG
jgi:hypothetical protein